MKVLDFGLAKATAAGTSGPQDSNNSPTLTARATQMGMILGTAAYCSSRAAPGWSRAVFHADRRHLGIKELKDKSRGSRALRLP